MVKVSAPVALLVLLLASACASNTPAGTQYVCTALDDTDCLEFLSGWTETEARSSCSPTASTFRTGADGGCRNGRIAHCTVSSGSQVALFNYYAGFGDGTVAYAQMTCSLMHGDFAAP